MSGEVAQRARGADAGSRGMLDARRSVTGARRTLISRMVGAGGVIVPYAQYFAQRLGRVGIVGIALCVFSAVTWTSANLPLQEQLLDQTVTLTQLESTPDGAPTVASSSSPQAQYDTFLRALPTPDDLPALMGKIVSVSVATGVELEEGNYELISAGKTGHVARYRVSLPVVGSYPQVRGFVDQALVAVPTMSLDGLTLERRAIGDGIVMAQLDFAVFVRATP